MDEPGGRRRFLKFAGALGAALTLLLIAAVAWRMAQTTAIVRRGIAQVTVGHGMAALPAGPSRAPLFALTIRRWTMVPIFGASAGLIASELFQKSIPFTFS